MPDAVEDDSARKVAIYTQQRWANSTPSAPRSALIVDSIVLARYLVRGCPATELSQKQQPSVTRMVAAHQLSSGILVFY